MKVLRAGNIWFMWVLWTVYVRSTVYQTSYRCKKQDGQNEEKSEPLFSVLEKSLASCAVSCWPDTYCLYFVYNRHNKLCHGYGDDVCDDEGSDKTSGDVVHQQICKKRCLKRTVPYKLTFKTGKERYAASKADLTVNITGPCGHVGTAIKNGKDIRLKRGRKSTFRFVGESVCKVRRIVVAFADACHRDDWFVAYVKVEYGEMATGDEVSTKFKTNYRLSANVDNKTTGLACFYVPRALFWTPVRIKCKPFQICEY